MFVAQQKRKDNIAEYMLYMWQIESVIRAAKFDIDIINGSIIEQMGLDENQRELVVEWYKGLIGKMKQQQLLSSGHLLELRDLMTELSYLHNSLLQNVKDANYGFTFNTARPFIEELKAKQEGITDDIEVCLNGLYAMWMLKASRKQISADTEKAMSAISKLMALLSLKYKEMMGAIDDVKS